MTKKTADTKTPLPVVVEANDAGALDQDDGAIALHLVGFRHQDENLQTKGLEVGERISNGRYTGATVQAMYATSVGIIVELAFGGKAVTVLHTGDTDAVLA